MARLFVAVWPPERILDELAVLERPIERGVRWTTRDQWHVTLRFLGEADPAPVAEALARMSVPAVTAAVGPRVERLGASVIVAPVDGLDDLAAAVRTATADLGEPPDPRGFSGHLTLARLRRGATCGLVGTPIAGEFDVTRIALVASDTRPDGARYVDLAHVRLEDP